MEFPPPPYGGKVQEAGARVQKTGNRAQKQLIWLSKKIPWVQHNTCRSKKNILTGSRKHTSKSPTFFVTLGPKKHLVRSKKHVQVQKKGAQVPKNMHPLNLLTWPKVGFPLKNTYYSYCTKYICTISS